RRAAAGTPWGIEQPDGSRLYCSAYHLHVYARSRFVPGQPRPHGYLEVDAALYWDGDEAHFEEEEHAETEA
ncbi:MAG: hypothetical protein ACO1SX_00175, partial [Actinomycetota bacterium]